MAGITATPGRTPTGARERGRHLLGLTPRQFVVLALVGIAVFAGVAWLNTRTVGAPAATGAIAPAVVPAQDAQVAGVAERTLLSAFADAATAAPPSGLASSLDAPGGMSAWSSWADEVPASLVDVEWKGVAYEEDRARATGEVHLLAPDPLSQERRIAMPVAATLERDGSGLWTVRNVSFERSGLGIVRDPVVVRTGSTIVLAEQEHADFARVAARTSAQHFARLKEQVAPFDDTGDGVFMVIAGTSTRGVTVLGQDPGRSLARASGVTTFHGDIVLDARIHPGAAREAVVVHELTHRAMISTAHSFPMFLVEGVATYEEARHVGKEMTIPMALILQEGFRSGALDYQGVLDGDSSWDTGEQGQVNLSYAASAATMAYIVDHSGERGLRRLMAAVGPDATDPDLDAALQESTGLTRAELEGGVRAWADRESAGYVLVG